MEFKERIRELRKSRDLTQSELADALNLTKSAISQWENGKREPDLETMGLICDYFNVDMNYLIGVEDVSSRFLTLDEMNLIEKFRESPPEIKKSYLTDFLITEEEKNLIASFRQSDETTKDIVRRLLPYYKLLCNTMNNN